MANLLDHLRSKIQLDCDTLDSSVASSLGPFVDCTSNQAIAASELAKSGHAELIATSLKQTAELHTTFEKNHVTFEELAVDVMTINLQAATLPSITGNVHIQTNPYHSYSTRSTIAHAERVISLFRTLHPNLDANRVCIKIPSTWEGLAACRSLQSCGIKTLATTLFTIEQAALAAHNRCSYIAPYVNELKVHFVPGHKDPNPGFALTHAAKLLFSRTGASTKVMPASLTSVQEVLDLVGKADHITVAPHLLRQLANMSVATYETTSSDAGADEKVEQMAKRDCAVLFQDEAKWRMAFTRSNDGADEKKLVDAINIFCTAQDQLEQMVKKHRAA